MKHLLRTLVTLALIVAIAAAAGAETTESAAELSARGNRAYETGEYESAVAAYRAALETGVVDASLEYNLANAYYKLDEIGRAILHYERALRIAPRDEDVLANLEHARRLLRDRQFLESEGFAKRALLWVPRRLSAGELIALTSAFYLLLMSVAIMFVFRETRPVTRLYRRLSVLSPGRLLGLEKTADFALAGATAFLLLAATASAAVVKYRAESRRLDAVVIQEEIPVYGGPSTQANVQFKIHEGTIARVADVRPGWVEIELPGELSGWVTSDAMERI